MPGDNLTDIEKQFIDQQVAEWKRMIYAKRAIGIDVDTLNTKLAVKHDNGEVWEILIKCKRIAEPVKTGVGISTIERTYEAVPRGMETIDLSGQLPSPDRLPPTSPHSPEKVAADMELLTSGQIHIGALAARALEGHFYDIRGRWDGSQPVPGSVVLHCQGLDVSIPQQPVRVDPSIKPGSVHERWHKKGLEQCPISMDDIMNLQQGLEAAGPFFKFVDDQNSGRHTHSVPGQPWWFDGKCGGE